MNANATPPSIPTLPPRARAALTLIALLLPQVLVGPAQAAACEFTAARQRFATLLVDEGLSGGALLLGNREGVLMERYLGNYDATTRVPIASASKLLSAVRIVQLAEQGALDLDAPVAQYLPQFTGTKGTMTLAQMFSHTAGYGGDSGAAIVFDDSISLAQAVDEIACCMPLPNGWTPGAQFAYGGVSMHVGGRVAEVVGGGDWQAAWQANIAAPLGITSIDYEAFGETTNYGIAGSARSTLRDYGRVLHPLINGGWSEGVRLLHPGSIANLVHDRVGALPVASAPPNAPAAVRYGLGNWIDATRPAGAPPLVHSLGALGFFPFLDFQRNVFGVFMIRGSAGVNAAALPVYEAMLVDIAAELDNASCDAVQRFDGVAGDGFESPAVDLTP